MTKRPRSTMLLALPGYAWGNLHVTKHSGEEAAGVVITPNCPGSLHLAPAMNGPKDWSPYGLVPKGWHHVLQIPESIPVHLLVMYVNIEGRNYMIQQSILIADPQVLYFVPL